MAIAPANERTVRFGVFEADLRAGELRKHGLKIKLQEQPFRLLAHLLERPGEVVTREELRKALWPEDTYVEFDNSLNNAVKKLRRTLNDSPDNPRYIETIPKRGYRFIHPVEKEHAPRLATVELPSPEKASWRRSHRVLAGAALLAALAGAIGAWRVAWKSGASRPPPIRLTSYSGSEVSPSFSPDGRQLAFAWDGEQQDNWDIYVKPAEPGPPVRLTRDPAPDRVPAWSPDGQWIAFVRLGEMSQVLLVSPTGGPERKILELGDFRAGEDSLPGRVAWTSDGKSLVLSYRTSTEEPWGLFLVSTETGEKQRLTSPGGRGWGDLDPAFSRDGRRLAFVRRLEGESELYVLPVPPERSPEKVGLNIAGEKQHPAWTPDGREIVLAISQTLWRIDPAGSKPPEKVQFDAGRSFSPAISRTGDLAYAHAAIGPGHEDVSQTGPAGPAKRLFSSIDGGTRLSPDGKTIAFSSGRSGTDEIWIRDADGSDPVQLTHMGHRGYGRAVWPRWSPDGASLVFGTVKPGVEGIWMIPATGGVPRKVGSGTQPSWSRDGRRIYFTKLVNDREEVFRTQPGGAEASTVRVTKNGGAWASESPDGRFLYYIRPSNNGTVWRMHLPSGEETKVVEGVMAGSTFAVSEDGIYFLPWSEGTGKLPLYFYDFRIGQKSVIQLVEGIAEFSLAPDGRSVIYEQQVLTDYKQPDLVLVRSFR